MMETADKKNKYAGITDEELVDFAHNGNNESMEELLKRYMGMVRGRARSYFLIGGETEDLVQEGMIGLFKAVRDFQKSKNVLFKSFARLCIDRQFSTAIKLSLREKHKPLSNYISLSSSTGGEEEKTLLDILESDSLSPEDILQGKEQIHAINARILQSLSKFEKSVLKEYLYGKSYGEISEKLACDTKAIDNALQRIKKKLTETNKAENKTGALMAYLALYRRFRPDTFEKLIGQEHITKTLTNQIKNDRIGHAYLFCGSRGTGKTSAAKIFAKAVNCETPQNGSPCNKCNTCKALSDPSNIDVLEIDAASNNRVDEIRDLRDKVMYPPVSGKFKVYIVDEVHMLTDSAFNALLKTLEEPPRHAIFILATTEVQKLPATILSRCMRFDFRLVSVEKIANLLKEIFDDIKKSYEEEAVTLIARAGEGSVRDALSLADMCVSYSDGKLTYDDVLEVIGASDKGKIYELADGILKGDLSLSVTLTDGLLNLGKGVGVLNRDLINHFRDLCVIRVSTDAKKLLGIPDRIFEKLQTSSKLCSMEKILRCLEIFSKTETELRFAVHPRVLFETAVFKAARPNSDYDKSELLVRITELEKKMASGATFSAPQPAKPQEAVLKREEVQEKNPEKTAVTPPPPAYTEREEERQEENTSDIFQKSRQPSTGVEAKRVWGVVLRTVRQTNFMLFPVCRDLTAEIRNGLFTILTNNEQEAKVLNLPANYKTIKDILDKEGHSSFVITDKGKQAETKSPDQKFDELKELLGDKLKFQ